MRAPTLRGVRGTTCVAVICGEIAFWRSEESTNPDADILHAVRPTLAIAHKEGETEVLDLIREVRAPFSPEAVVEEFSSTMQRYRCSRCYGDRYGAAWPVEQFQKAGIHLEPSEKPKNALYLDLLPLINSRAVRLLDHERMSCSS